MGERRVTDAGDASETVKKYAETASLRLYWHDVVECKYDEESDEWHMIYEASPSFSSPYYRYEAIIDAKNGRIKSVKRLEK